MDEKTVGKLERDIEEAIAQVIIRVGLKKLPLLPGAPDDSPDGQGGRRRLRVGS
jgi:hypothetical protein